MNERQALKAVEELRKGIPPLGLIEHFTVGRKSEISELQQHLEKTDATVLLLKANYGSGKSHLLRLIREKALELRYAVSYVALDAKADVRFNRMDQILGAILRTVEVPGSGSVAGVRGLFDFLGETIEKARLGSRSTFWENLTNEWKWDFSETLKSPGLFVALRAWITKDSNAQELVVDWLLKSDEYKAQRRLLYTTLVANQRRHFRDPRPEYQFYNEKIFFFRENAYQQSWDALTDVDRLLKSAGMSGLIVLFDEFEDILTNLNRVNFQEAAFWNLFLFFSGKRFPGMTFYAVTPGFVEKCKSLLLEKGRFDFDYKRFDHLPTFSMSPLAERELQQLASRMIDAHAVAYGYEPTSKLRKQVEKIVTRDAGSPSQDRARNTIKEVVKQLDESLDEG